MSGLIQFQAKELSSAIEKALGGNPKERL